ncbi:hypothetical protein PGB90_001130 [Kerria lacca]
MMKIRPYPGKIALVRNQDGVEKEVTMNYESSWQECLQLWGSQNAHHANGYYDVTKTLDVLPSQLPTPSPLQQNHHIESSCFDSVTGYSTRTYNVDCDSAYNINGTVPSHSFNYFNNFVHDGNGEPDTFNVSRSYGRQRCCPQILSENQIIPPPPPNIEAPAQPIQNDEVYLSSTAISTPPGPGEILYPNRFQFNENINGDGNGWMVTEDCEENKTPMVTISSIQNGGIASTTPIVDHYSYKNNRKLYRAPTVIDKNAGLPYVRENVSGDVAFDVELYSNRVPSTDNNGFLIPRPKLIVPVHTYGSRKRRTGNILHSKRRGSDSEQCSSSTSASLDNKKHHTSCPDRVFLKVSRMFLAGKRVTEFTTTNN